MQLSQEARRRYPHLSKALSPARPSFSELATKSGIDMKKSIANLRRRLRYQSDPHSEYVFPKTELGRWSSAAERAAVATMRLASASNDVPAYVAAWCQANHLKGA